MKDQSHQLRDHPHPRPAQCPTRQISQQKSKVSSVVTKEPCIPSEEPYIPSKGRYISSKEPWISFQIGEGTLENFCLL